MYYEEDEGGFYSYITRVFSPFSWAHSLANLLISLQFGVVNQAKINPYENIFFITLFLDRLDNSAKIL